MDFQAVVLLDRIAEQNERILDVNERIHEALERIAYSIDSLGSMQNEISSIAHDLDWTKQGSSIAQIVNAVESLENAVLNTGT
jgi:hypothetical protein